MNLDTDDRAKLAKALDDAFNKAADLDDLAYLHLGISLSNLPGENRPAVKLIQWAEENDKVESLIRSARAENSTNQLLAVVAEAILKKLAQYAPTYRAADPYQVCLPKQDLPFINRRALRDTLRMMVAGGGKAILAVEGNPRMGKTHTSHLISYLGNKVRHAGESLVYRTVNVHLGSHSSAFNAGDFAEQVALRLGRADTSGTIPPRPTSEHEARWEPRVAAWIVGTIHEVVKQQNLRQVWLVVDGFQQTRVSQSTRDLLVRLAHEAHYNVPEMRVILLDYPDALPDLERFVERDRLEWPTKSDLKEFYRAVVEGTGRSMSSSYIGKLANATWIDAEPLDRDFMERLDNAIRARLPILLKPR
jgi:hypothetical protein